jgi:hypothetical protein
VGRNDKGAEHTAELNYPRANGARTSAIASVLAEMLKTMMQQAAA